MFMDNVIALAVNVIIIWDFRKWRNNIFRQQLLDVIALAVNVIIIWIKVKK